MRFPSIPFRHATALMLLAMAQPAFAADSRLPEIVPVTQAMQGAIEHHEIAGAVTLVASPDRILHLSAAGQADIAAGAPMQTNALFWIASMTKPVTATAIMMLQDEGKLSVDDPVAKYVPEL